MWASSEDETTRREKTPQKTHEREENTRKRKERSQRHLKRTRPRTLPAKIQSEIAGTIQTEAANMIPRSDSTRGRKQLKLNIIN